MSNSPFTSDMSDEDRQRYEQHARENYELHKYYAQRARGAWHDYAKWILASLLVVHGGAIYIIRAIWSSAGLLGEAGSRVDLLEGAKFHAAGIVVTILAGSIAWMNFQAIEIFHNDKIDPRVLYRTDIHKTDGKTDAINSTYFLGIICVVMSIYFMIVGFMSIFIFLNLIL